jgi:hypothetical protein
MAIQWNQVKPDFSGSSSSMRNAMTGISQAGTVFDGLKKDIQEAEQAKLEQLYKERQLQQNADQFAQSLALDQARLEEEIAARQADDIRADKESKSLQDYRAMQMREMQQKINNSDYLAQAEQEYLAKLNEGTTAYNAMKKQLGSALDANGNLKSDITDTATKELYEKMLATKAQLEMLGTSATGADDFVRRRALELGYKGPLTTSWSTAAEQERANKRADDLAKEAEKKAYRKNVQDISNAFVSGKQYTPETGARLSTVFNSVIKNPKYADIAPEFVRDAVITFADLDDNMFDKKLLWSADNEPRAVTQKVEEYLTAYLDALKTGKPIPAAVNNSNPASKWFTDFRTGITAAPFVPSTVVQKWWNSIPNNKTEVSGKINLN